MLKTIKRFFVKVAEIIVVITSVLCSWAAVVELQMAVCENSAIALVYGATLTAIVLWSFKLSRKLDKFC